MIQYSEAEMKLFQAINQKWADIAEMLNPSALYSILAREMFEENRTGPEIDALRRACRAFTGCQVYRLTPEFDKLCSFESK